MADDSPRALTAEELDGAEAAWGKDCSWLERTLFLTCATLRQQLAEARVTCNRLNKRAQEAESVIAQSGIVGQREQGPHNRSLGRALANYAASTATRELEAERRTTARLTEALGKYGVHLHECATWPWEVGVGEWDTRPVCTCGLDAYLRETEG